MTSWRPQSSPFRFAWLVFPLLPMALAIWVWTLLSARASDLYFDVGVFLLGLALFLTLVLAGLLGYVAWCVLSMRYTMDEDNLYIRCGGVTHVVPLDNISSVHSPGARGDGTVIAVQRKGLMPPVPGYVVGEGRNPQLGRVIQVATVPPASQVFVATPRVTFGLSPDDQTSFVAELNKRRKLDPYPETPVHARLASFNAWGARLWSDRVARALLLLALVLNGLLFLYISSVYVNLPSQLPLHWNAQGEIDIIGDPIELLRLPVFALLVWLVNTLAGWWALPRERAATLFLLAGAVATQIVFAAGALSIVGRGA